MLESIFKSQTSRHGKVCHSNTYNTKRPTSVRYWGLFLALIAGFILSTSACQGQRRRGKQPPPPAPIIKPMLVCSLATGGGYGKIPRYKAEFFRPGKLVYTGRKNTPKLGKYGYILPDVLVKNLLLDAKKAKLITLPEPGSAPPDSPVDTLYIWVDGKARTFRFTAVNAPDVLVKYVQNIRDNVSSILEEQEPAETPLDSNKVK